MTNTDDFNDSFAYSSERPDGVMLQWAIGLTATNRQMVAGWFIETGKDNDIDDALQSIGIPRVSIKHGSGNTVTHWHLEQAELLIVAQDTEPAGRGTVYKWIDGRSKFKARVYVRALVDAGYMAPLLITFKSTLTNDIRATLRRLYEMVRATGNKSIPVYAFWLPTGPGDDVAKGTTQTKNVAPPIALLPETMTREWLVGQYAKKTHPALIEQVEQELPAVIAWSVKESSEEATTVAPATVPQREYLAVLADKRDWSAQQLVAYAKEQGIDDLVTMSRDQATALIENIKSIVEHRAAPAQVRPDAPKDAREAERRFFSKYGPIVADYARCTPADVDWSDVLAYLNWPEDEDAPTTIEGWYGIARAMQKVAA